MNRNYLFILTFLLITSCAHRQNIEASDAHIQLGLAYLTQHEATIAKQKFLLALQDAPNHPPAWDAFAYYLEQTKEISSAENYYKHAIELAPREGSVHNNYGVFLCRQARFEEAYHQFNLALLDKNYLKTIEVKQNASTCASINSSETPFPSPACGRGLG